LSGTTCVALKSDETNIISTHLAQLVEKQQGFTFWPTLYYLQCNQQERDQRVLL